MQPETAMTKQDQRLLRYALAFAILLALLCLGYLEENYRGKRTWTKTKHDLEARGGTIDWTNYFPAPVPDSRNFFGVPEMQRWFVGRGGNDLSSRLNGARINFLAARDSDVVARVTIVNHSDKFAADDADVVLEYDSDLGTVALPLPEPSQTYRSSTRPTYPLMIFADAPLPDAIRNLARQAGINYVIDARIGLPPYVQPPVVSVRWTNVTAQAALGSLLKQYHLQMRRHCNADSLPIWHIVERAINDPNICSEAAAATRLQELVESAFAAVTNDLRVQTAHTALGVTLVSSQPPAIKPIRVFVVTDTLPDTNSVADFFPIVTNAYCSWVTSRARVESTGSNSFQVRMNPVSYVAAADYLAVSESFAADFNLIRESLKRPCMQMNGDYSHPFTLPFPNFVCLRLLAQTLSDRARCHLLLGRPEDALSDLDLLRGLCRMLEVHPTTLVATMIDSAVIGLYADSVAEGIRVQAWRESQLAAIEKQLGEVDLLTLLARSFALERSSQCHLLETAGSGEFEKMLSLNPATNFWNKLKDPVYLALTIGPRGWVYQNMAKIARLDQGLMDSLNLNNRSVSAARTDAATGELLAVSRFSPYSFLTPFININFTRAVQTLSRNQCKVDEAIVACALERHRLAHGQYPQTLDTLVPEFVDAIPTDIINGGPLKYHVEGGQFVLYSVGWNEKDDGGRVVTRKDGSVELKYGDWVWGAFAP